MVDLTEMKDPVCGMTVTKDTAAGEAEHEGTTHYFCSSDCRQQFEAEPEKYAHGKSAGGNAGGDIDIEHHEPPFTKSGGMVSPKFGSAGSGGAEYERLPEQHDK